MLARPFHLHHARLRILLTVLAALAAAGLAIIVAPPAAATTGGPDSCGYLYADSTSPGGPVYNFVDISGTGTIASTSDDAPVSGIPIGFTFTYCGTPYTTVQLAPNGYICFNAGDFCSSFSPTAAPCGAGCDPSDYFAGYWGDLYPPGCAGACTFYQTIGPPGSRVFIYEEKNVPHCCSATPVAGTFEMKLFESGIMEAHYQSMTGDGSETVLGIQDQGGLDGLNWQDCFAGCSVASGTAVRYFNNNPPVVADDACSTQEDVATTAASCNVLANDSDPEGSPLTVTAAGPVSPPGAGTVAIVGGGSGVVFTPAADQNAVTLGGPATFPYTVSDGTSASTGTVTVTVAAINDAPTLTGGPAVDYSENYPLFNLAGWGTGVSPGPATATDEAAQSVTFVISSESNPALFSGPGGSLPTLQRAISATSTSPSPTSGSFAFLSFKPATGQSGTDVVCFRPTDSGPAAPAPNTNVGAPACATIQIHPCGPGITPVGEDQALTTIEDTPINIVLHAWGGDCSMLNIAPTSLTTSKGALTLVTGVSPTNPYPLYTYTPGANKNGMDSFTFTAWDASLTSPDATVTIDITPVDDPPIVADDAYVAYTYWTLTVPVGTGVLANDQEVDGQTLTATIVTPPVNVPTPADFSFFPDGSFKYRPTPGYVGPDQFTYMASDGGLTAIATAFIDVRKNIPPVAAFTPSSNPAQVNEQVAFTDQSYDMDGTIVWYSWDLGDGFMTNEESPTHSFAAPGTYSVRLTVRDDVGNTSSVLHALVIEATPGTPGGPPVFSGAVPVPVAYAGENITAFEGDTVTLLGSAQGGGTMQYAWRQLSGPTLHLSDPTVAQPTFRAPWLGTDHPDVLVGYELRVANGQDSLPSFVSVTIKARNHSPVVEAGKTFTMLKGETGTLDGTKTTDPDGDSLTYAWTQLSGTPVQIHGADKALATFDVPPALGDTMLLFQLAASDANVTRQASVLAVLLPAGSDRLDIGFTAVQLAPQHFRFDAQPPGLAFAWSFGDGETATGPSVTHDFAGPGTYNVTLTASAESVTAATLVKPVTATAPAAAPTTATDPAAASWVWWVAGGLALLALAAGGAYVYWRRRAA